MVIGLSGLYYDMFKYFIDFTKVTLVKWENSRKLNWDEEFIKLAFDRAIFMFRGKFLLW